MGNWRSVQIIGTCGPQDISALKKALDHGPNYEIFHCLVNGGLNGLPMWATETIDAVGNLAERGFDAEDVAKQLEELAKIAPSLKVKIHCGGDYEDKKCIATVTLDSGVAVIGAPEVEDVGEVSELQMMLNFAEQVRRQRGVF